MHAAWFDVVTGCGWITAPATVGPMLLDGPIAAPVAANAVDLAAADWSAVIARLLADGWDLLSDGAEPVAVMPDGRDVLGLYRDEALTVPDLGDLARVEAAFVSEAGARML